MANQDRQSGAVPKREPLVHPRRRGSLTAAHRGGQSGDWRYLAAYRRLLARHRRFIRQVGIGSGILAGILILGLAGLWWRLSSGPIQLDAFTPWLASAIADNFGSRERVEVGGTQIERTENGGAAVRVRDIVVRDPDGTVVASAPKAEIKRLRLEPAQRSYAGRKPQSGRRRTRRAYRAERRGDGLCFRRRQAGHWRRPPFRPRRR